MNEGKDTNYQSKWILLRYAIVVLLLVGGVGGGIVYSITKIAFVEREAWLAIAEREKKRRPDSIIKPERGKIYAYDGRLMATSFPLYNIFMDFRGRAVDTLAFNQTPPPKKNGDKPTEKEIEAAKRNGVDSLSFYLAKKFNRNEEALKKELRNAMKTKAARYKLTEARISYSDLKEVRQYPFFRLGINKSGRIEEEYIERRNPYTTLAARTIGDVYSRLDSLGYSRGRTGMELQYDSLLRGKAGLKTRERIAGTWMDVVINEATKGIDVKTTIDLDIQYAAEKSLMNMMYQTRAETGSAVVMDVKTGEVRAIANLGRTPSGNYAELDNYAVSDMLEPGSTIKTASIMIALEDGLCHPDDRVETGDGHFRYADRYINDHNRDRGGNGNITVEEAIYRSSNIGVARTIMKAYDKNPERFMEGFARLGFTEDLHIDLPNAGRPRFKKPGENDWYQTTLPWTSFGYESMIPPIYMLAFYNAIANNGRMMRPFFVKEFIEEGKTVKRFEPVVVRDAICSSKTLKLVRNMLIGVMEDEHGTGRQAYSSIVRIAGKTGTAQIAGRDGYGASGIQTSFAGYFPAEAPEYSCIAVVRKPQNVSASGGGTAGRIVRDIAEAIYTSNHPLDIGRMEAASSAALPSPKAGDKQSLKRALKNLDIDSERDKGSSSWATASKSANGNIVFDDINISEGLIPRVTGMGAKDAVYLLESAGLRVSISGAGRVVSQSIQPGQKVIKGQTIVLALK